MKRAFSSTTATTGSRTTTSRPAATRASKSTTLPTSTTSSSKTPSPATARTTIWALAAMTSAPSAPPPRPPARGRTFHINPQLKTFMKILSTSILFISLLASSWAATTINTANKYAYGANLGWMDWRGDTANGTVIGDYVCMGYIYAANVGWINLGSGSPTNGIQYQNLAANDFGVNQVGLGNLRGYAWGANIGWLIFSSTGAPKVDLFTGKLGGYVWSANCGWISLSNAFAY